MPFNAKDWSSSIPAWLIAFGFLVGIGVWAAQKLGLVKKSQNGENGHGKALVELELKMATEIRKQVDELEKVVRERMHGLSNKLNEQGMRHEVKLGELDTEIKLLKLVITGQQGK